MTNTTEAALRDALEKIVACDIIPPGLEADAKRALSQPSPASSTAGEGGPFHVSRSSDGEKEWFSARDAAAGVSIPAKCRDDAYALVASLNRSCVTYAAALSTLPHKEEATPATTTERGQG